MPRPGNCRIAASYAPATPPISSSSTRRADQPATADGRAGSAGRRAAAGAKGRRHRRDHRQRHLRDRELQGLFPGCLAGAEGALAEQPPRPTIVHRRPPQPVKIGQQRQDWRMGRSEPDPVDDVRLCGRASGFSVLHEEEDAMAHLSASSSGHGAHIAQGHGLKSLESRCTSQHDDVIGCWVRRPCQDCREPSTLVSDCPCHQAAPRRRSSTTWPGLVLRLENRLTAACCCGQV